MIFIIPRRRKKAAPRAMTLVPTFLYTWLFSAHSQAEQKQQKRNTSMSSLTTGGLNPINFNMETHIKLRNFLLFYQGHRGLKKLPERVSSTLPQ